MIPLWPEHDPAPEPRRRWIPRCDDCGRRIWSTNALQRRFGLHLGDTCYRKRRIHHQRLAIRITVTPPGHIPGQLEIQEDQ